MTPEAGEDVESTRLGRQGPIVSPAPGKQDNMTDDILTAALEYAAMGWHLLPVEGKRPARGIRSWSEQSTTDPEVIASWLAGTTGVGIGVDLARSGLVVIDVDHLDELPEDLRTALDESATWTHRGHPERLSAVFRAPEGPPVKQRAFAWGDVKAAGGYIVLSPSPHAVGGRYRWVARSGDLPPVFPASIADLVGRRVVPTSSTPGPAWTGREPTSAEESAGLARLILLRDRLASTSTGGRNHALNATAVILGHYVPHYLSEIAVTDALLAACATNGLLADDGEPPCRATIASGLRRGMQEPQEIRTAPDRPAGPPGPPEPPEGPYGPPEPPEEGPQEDRGFGRAALTAGWLKSAALGRRMARDWHGRHMHAGGLGWHSWDSMRWAPVSSDAIHAIAATWAEDLIIRLLREPDTSPQDLAAALRYREARNVEALVKGARTAPALLVDPGDLDQSEGLLNCRNGIVDLRTGDLLPHDPARLMTKVAGADYEPGASHPDWTKALEALPDADTIRYVQVHVGSAASGETQREGPVAFHRGDGANGKTTVLGSLVAAFGDYATQVPDALLSAAESHPTAWMPLRGARLAYLEELPEDHVLPVAKIKKLADTPKLTAHLMRQDDVTFDTTHTLLISTNYMPRVTETDHGTWRRLVMIPYPFTFNGADRDVTLKRRLNDGKGQRAAVLAWIVEGARAWYAAGRVLPHPGQEVELTTGEWRADGDPLGEWLEDFIHVDPGARIETARMLECFNTAQPTGARPWNHILFGGRLRAHQWLKDRGLAVDRGARGRDKAGISGAHMTGANCPGTCPQYSDERERIARSGALWTVR